MAPLRELRQKIGAGESSGEGGCQTTCWETQEGATSSFVDTKGEKTTYEMINFKESSYERHIYKLVHAILLGSHTCCNENV